MSAINTIMVKVRASPPCHVENTRARKIDKDLGEDKRHMKKECGPDDANACWDINSTERAEFPLECQTDLSPKTKTLDANREEK